MAPRGFPDFLSFGGFADLTYQNEEEFVAARVSSIFGYAGIDGAGDSTTFLVDDFKTRRVISLAKSVQEGVGGGHTVLPVLVSYTCNLSLGDAQAGLQNAEGLGHGFANLILSLRVAKESTSGESPVPAAFIINPDFLGEAQRNLSNEYQLPVREPLQSALDHQAVDAEIPDTITDSLRGYVQAVNWLIRTVAPDMSFGWSASIWGAGSSGWVYSSDQSPAEVAKVTADYIKFLGVYDAEYAPDFLAVDRYEADDFTARAYMNGYCYGPTEWGRFFDFCKALHENLSVPVLPWQIPASHIPTQADNVEDEFDAQHWGTGGSYVLGDTAVGSDVNNINQKVLSLGLNASLTWTNSIEELFQRAEPFDLSKPAYQDFPPGGIFAVLLGGGATTGVISTVGDGGSWAREKLAAYSKNPVPLE
ncbi:hypothetical protein PT974_02793 [Cladobotryum mycophilum]|uniref:Uncharacterized protein n=1 Tax=Cladobotryum mycophilum TaxID=491253 RepID=A0ABR0SZ17_9HYPO